MKLVTTFFRRFISVALGLSVLIGTQVHAVTVDLLILYDAHSKSYFGGDVRTAMTGWVNTMNNVYRDSDVDIELRLVGLEQLDITGNDDQVLDRVTDSKDALAIRNRVGADFVSYLNKAGDCGIGWKAVDKNLAYNVVGPDCSAFTMVHEIGHNMGLDHSRRQGDTGGTRYRYGLGYGVDNVFSTIMAYASEFKTSRIGRFSNADQTNCKGLRCGVAIGTTNEAHAAKAISNVREEVAKFRAAVIGGASSAPRSSVAASSRPRSSSGSTSSTPGGSCYQYSGTEVRAEINLNSTTCVKFNGGLSGKTVQVWDSDTASCDFRGTVKSTNGAGSQTVDSNYESFTGFTGDTLSFSPSNGCKAVKVRRF